LDHVDLILVYPEYNICIKDYWTVNNITNELAQNYIKSTNIFNQTNNYNKKFYFVILKKNISKSSNQNYNIDHYKCADSEYLYIIEKNLINKLLKHFTLLLYSNNIFFYESDGSTIMLDLTK